LRSPKRAPAEVNEATASASIGSAPFSAKRMVDRSSEPSSALASCRPSTAYAKFGAAVTVPP